MDKETVIQLAQETVFTLPNEDPWDFTLKTLEQYQHFAKLVAAHERNKVAAWMIDRSYATGHGDTTEDLLKELEWQIKEREREKCANIAESYEPMCDTCPSGVANAVRSRK